MPDEVERVQSLPSTSLEPPPSFRFLEPVVIVPVEGPTAPRELAIGADGLELPGRLWTLPEPLPGPGRAYRAFFVPAGKTYEADLGFLGRSVVINNPTAQWLFLPGCWRFVPPQTFGMVLNIPSPSQKAWLVWQAPEGQAQAAQVSGQVALVEFTEHELAPSPGVSLPVGLPNLVGDWHIGYAGAAGTATVADGERVVGITCHSTAGGTMQIGADPAVPIPANVGVYHEPEGQLVGPVSIVFAGTDTYSVAVLR